MLIKNNYKPPHFKSFSPPVQKESMQKDLMHRGLEMAPDQTQRDQKERSKILEEPVGLKIKEKTVK